jgi:hypothetical protein
MNEDCLYYNQASSYQKISYRNDEGKNNLSIQKYIPIIFTVDKAIVMYIHHIRHPTFQFSAKCQRSLVVIYI